MPKENIRLYSLKGSEKEIYLLCGICGFYTRNDESLNNLIKMNNTMRHRGSDDHGEEILGCKDGIYRVGIAHRRLSVQDLSDLGHQPMHSIDGRVIIVCVVSEGH